MIKSLCEVKKMLESHGIEYKAIYLYGSRIYGTDSESSDWDFLVVSNHKFNFESISFETEEQFLSKLSDHDIKNLEMIFISEKFKIESDEWKNKIKDWSLDLSKLRIAISAKASNSWVKAKKKIEVENELYIGLKSLFHALRMINFGIQISQHGHIQDFSSANIYWEEIKKETDWKILKNKFQPVYNLLKTQFRKQTDTVI